MNMPTAAADNRPSRLLMGAITMGVPTLLAGLASTYYWVASGGKASSIGPLMVLFALGIMIASTSTNLFIRWVRWHFLVRSRGIMVSARDSLMLWTATLPSIATPFYLGELFRYQLLKKKYHAPFREIAFVWLTERSTDVMVLLGVLFVLKGMFWPFAIATPIWALLLLKYMEGHRQDAFLNAMFLVVGSVIAWIITLIAFDTIISILGFGVGFGGPASAFAEGTLSGAASAIPMGVWITGSTIIRGLDHAGVPLDTAVLAVFILRAGTAWFALALGVVSAVINRKQLKLMSTETPLDNQAGHFNDISDIYANEIGEGLRERLLDRKIGMIVATVGGAKGLTGLDVGCGQGQYSIEMAARGATMSGVDLSQGQISGARKEAVKNGESIDFRVASATSLPFPDNSFDFAYAINSFHHILDREMQALAIEEVVRVLKPGGVFILHEMNPRNPLYRFYLGYVFPLIKNIDEGVEQWLSPLTLPAANNARWATVTDYFTFLPDFIPRLVLRVLVPLENALEQSSLQQWSAHYMGVLKKNN